MKRWVTIGIGLIISAVALYFSFRDTNLAEIGDVLAHVRPLYVVLSLIIIAISAYVRGVRWSILLQGRIKVWDAHWLWVAGFMFNNVLPLKLGEIVRAYLASRRPNVAFGTAFSSIVVERLLDLVSVAMLLGTAIFGLNVPDWARSAGILMGVGGLGALVALAVAARWPKLALNFGTRILTLVPTIDESKAHKFLEPFIEGLAGVSNPRTFWGTTAMTVLAWALSALSMWVMLLAFWETPLPVPVVLLVLGAAGLGVAVPAAPSGLGPYQAAVITVMTALGYELSKSQSFAVIMHLAMFVVTTGLGFIGVMREGISFGELTREAQQIQSHTHEETATP
jgi:uncharacterized protein (TIRG00374 family)